MPDFSGIQGGNTETLGASTATSMPATVTTNASANLKGSYTQLVAATAYASGWVLVLVSHPSTSAIFLVDVAVGAAASEQVILPNLMVSPSSSGAITTTSYLFPISIPVGTRISARAQCNTATGRTIQVEVVLFDQTMLSGSPLGVVSGFGQDTSDSTGVSMDPGGTINTKGAYVQLVASTTYPIRWLVLFFGGAGGAITVAQDYLVDIAVGAAASEQVIVSNLSIATGTVSDWNSGVIVGFPVNIPAGSRIAVRCQGSANTATERLVDVAAWGVS